jgi:uncharacterized membrane protein
MKYALLSLRIGLAFAFAYAGIGGFVNPQNWVGYFPDFVQHLMPVSVLLGVWGAVELLLAAALLFMRNVFLPAVIAAVLVLGVTVTNLASFDIVFRDVTIFFAALALASLTKQGPIIGENIVRRI